MRLHSIILRIIPVTVTLSLVQFTETDAQTIGMPLEGGSFEVGYTHRWFKRNVKPDFTEPVTWQTAAYYIRYGLATWVTLGIEGKLSLGHHPDSQFPRRDYRDMVFGGEIAATVLSLNDFCVRAVLHYSERFCFDRSMERHHKQEQSVLAGIGVQHRLVFTPIEFTAIVSPVFAYDELTDYAPRETYTNKSVKNLGLVVGLDVVAYDHARLFGQLVFVSFWQPRIGAGYIF